MNQQYLLKTTLQNIPPKIFLFCSSTSQTRILGFRRAPLVVGRFVNLRTEIKPVATEQLLSTFLTVGKKIIEDI